MPKPVKICFVGFYAWPLFRPARTGDIGGAEVQLYTLARELARDSGFHVDFVVRDESGGSELIDGVSVHKLPLIRKPGPGRQLAYAAGLWRLLRTIRPDVVVQRAAGSLTALLGTYCALYRKRFVYMIAHDADVEPEKPPWFPGAGAWRAYRFGLRLADRVIAQHDGQRQRLLRNYGKACIVRPCALEAIDALPVGARRTILWVGRCERIKQPEMFIALAQAFPRESFVMVWPPAASGPAYFESIRSQALKLDNLTFVEYVAFAEIGAYFRAALVFVNTALQEGFPNTFVQAWMNGAPVLSLAVDSGGVLARHGIGISCGGSAAALEKALSSLLEDHPRRERLSRSAYTYAREHHDIRRQIEFDRLWLSGSGDSCAA
jgi:glycosyltransferase involved in cell wall biosynthesis